MEGQFYLNVLYLQLFAINIANNKLRINKWNVSTKDQCINETTAAHFNEVDGRLKRQSRCDYKSK